MLAGIHGCRIARVAPGRRVEGWEPGVALLVVDGALLVPSVCPARGRSAVEVVAPGEAIGFEPVGPRSSKEGRTPSPNIHPPPMAPVAARVLSIPRSVVTRVFAERTGAAEALFDLAVAHANRVERRLVMALTLPLVERLHAELVDLSLACGSPVPHGRVIDLPLTQDLLADLMGVARESVNRAVRTLVDRGMVEHAGKRYVVPGPPVPP